MANDKEVASADATGKDAKDGTEKEGAAGEEKAGKGKEKSIEKELTK